MRRRRVYAELFFCLSFVGWMGAGTISAAQEAVGDRQTANDNSAALPENPVPQITAANATEPPQQSAAQHQEHQKAEKQLHEEEKQRVVGIVPLFYSTYHQNAVPLSPGEKFHLAILASVDPGSFAAAVLTGAYHELSDHNDYKRLSNGTTDESDGTGFGWGAKGYFQRVGAGYLDTVDQTMLGSAVFPILFRQDPRYFRLGHGSLVHRTLFAAATSVIAKSDRTRHWEPNYSNVLGNIAAGEISNFYYPSGDPANLGLTLSTAAIETVEGGIGNVFQEFWPDISRRLFHKDPTHGRDALYEKQYEEGPLKKTQP